MIYFLQAWPVSITCVMITAVLFYTLITSEAWLFTIMFAVILLAMVPWNAWFTRKEETQ